MIVASLALVAGAASWKIATSSHVPPRVAATPNPVPAYIAPVAGTDAVQLDNLFLTPQHGSALAACHKMADRLGFAVPCPDLLPVDAIISGPTCCIFQSPTVAPLFVLESRFAAPIGYPPAIASRASRQGHLVIIAEHRTSINAALACQATVTLGPGPTIWGAPSYWERCPSAGTNRGHLILEWDSAGIDYSVSLHGETEEDHTAIFLIAEQLTAVAPR